MKTRIFLSLFIATTTILNAQKLTVPDSILKDLHTLIIPHFNNSEDTFVFKVVYPSQYDSTKTYPVMLGLSGGNQTEVIVNYCYAAWFKSDYFKNHLTILPVNNNDKNLKEYSPREINSILTTIKHNFPVSSNNWVIVGTSNGGRATFNFITEDPALFQGLLVIPGNISNKANINKSWSHLKIILAYGDQDNVDWIKNTEMAKNELSQFTDNVQIVVLKGQGHILSIDFDIDFVYKHYFEK